MTTSICLIGPVGAGKTTLAPLLAARLGWPSIELDDLRWTYYAEIGYDAAYVETLKAAHDWTTIGRYWKPFEIHAVERTLVDYPDGYVISFGAGHSVYDDPAQWARAEIALAPFPHVFLLMPVPDLAESAQILRARIAAMIPEIDQQSLDTITAINASFMASPSNARLARHTLYSHGLTPDELCDAAFALVQAQ